MKVKHIAVVIVAAAATLSLSACKSTYYGAWNVLGKDKAELMHRHIDRAEEKLSSVRAEYQDAADRLRTLSTTDTAEERAKVYNAFAKEVKAAEDEREELIDIADTLERTGEDLFAAWEKEMASIEDPDLVERSRERVERARQSFQDTVSALNEVRSDLNALRARLNDQLSFLRFNVDEAAMDALRLRLPEIDSAMLQVDREIQNAQRELITLREATPR